MENKPITLWYRYYKDIQAYKFNHIEDGHSEERKPSPKFDSQKKWKYLKWIKDHAHMDKNQKVVK